MLATYPWEVDRISHQSALEANEGALEPQEEWEAGHPENPVGFQFLNKIKKFIFNKLDIFLKSLKKR
jgi:hypothetical protein